MSGTGPTSDRPRRIAILGDRVPGYTKHDAIAPALERAATAAGLRVDVAWVPSERLAESDALEGFDGVFVAPQSEAYCRHVDGVIDALREARETGLSCLAVCGGAQLALRELARAVAGPELGDPIDRPIACDPSSPPAGSYRVDGLRPVRPVPGTLAAEAYGRREVSEPFECNGVLDPAAEPSLRRAGVRVAARTPGIGATIFEWPDHPFHVATLFLPHWSPDPPHPLLVALLRASSARPGKTSITRR